MPFNPPPMPQTGQNYGRGVAKLLEGLGAAVERKKNENADAKAVEGIMKRNPELLDEVGYDIDSFQGLSSREKVRTFQFLNEKLAIDKVKTNLAAMREQTQQMQFNRGERQAEQQDISGALKGLQQMNMPQVQPGAVGPMGTPAMFSTPAQNPNQMGAILTKLSAQFPRAAATLRDEVKQQMELRQQQQGGARPPLYSEDEVTGARHVTYGNQILPSGINPRKAGTGAAGATTAPRVTSADRRAALEALYGKGGVGGLVDQVRMAQQAGKVGTVRELEAQIQQWQAVLGQPVAVGGAKQAVATGSADDPLGIFQ